MYNIEDMSKKISSRNVNILIVIASLISMGSVLAFFVVTTLLMTMTGEDILHQNGTLNVGVLATIENVYGFLPRIGEFFQRLSIQFYDYQTESLNGNVVWRLFDALLCFVLIYLVTMLSLGRRLRLELKDSLIFLTVFVMFVMSNHNEVFMMRFSYLHNYIPILLALSATAYVMLHMKGRDSVPRIMLGVLVGVTLGASNEIAPIAFLMMALTYVVYQKVKHGVDFRVLLKKSKTKSALVVGVLVGLVFMLSSGSILSRGDSAYGVVYDYVSIFGVFGDSFYTIAKLVEHLIFNSRYLYVPIIAMLMFLMAEVYLTGTKGKKKKGEQSYVALQLSALGFVVLYMLATSQMSVLDDLYPRFMSPVFLAVVVSFMAFGSHLIDLLKPKTWQLAVALVVPFVITGAAIVDVAYGFGQARQDYGTKMDIIKGSQPDEVCVDKQEFERQSHSPLFQFTQFSPFEEWTGDWGDARVFGKTLIYSGSCSN